MNRRGRPSKNDSIGLLAMARVTVSNPNITPTLAFREVYPSLQGEQSEEAARVRYLRKFKKQGVQFIAQLQRPRNQQSCSSGDVRQRLADFGRPLETLQLHSQTHFSSSAVMNAAREIERITANEAYVSIAQEMQRVVANDGLSRVIRELESVIANDRFAAAALHMDKLVANDAFAKAAQLSESIMANKDFQQAIQYASRAQF